GRLAAAVAVGVVGGVAAHPGGAEAVVQAPDRVVVVGRGRGRGAAADGALGDQAAVVVAEGRGRRGRRLDAAQVAGGRVVVVDGAVAQRVGGGADLTVGVVGEAADLVLGILDAPGQAGQRVHVQVLGHQVLGGVAGVD